MTSKHKSKSVPKKIGIIGLGNMGRGIAKNLARAQTMFALANLYAVRHRLLPPQEECVL